MKLSDFIRQLQEIYDDHGDIPVVTEDVDGGDWIDVSISQYHESANICSKVIAVGIDPVYPNNHLQEADDE